MSKGNAQINAQKQQQNIQQVQMNPQMEALNNGYTVQEFQELEREKKEREDLFFRQLLSQDENYKELGELLNYVKERNQKDWTQNFDECGKQSEKIFEKFKGLYAKNAGIQNWQEGNQELEELKAKSRALTETMTKRDKAQAVIRDNADFREFDKEIRTMVEKSSSTDSKTYKMVIKVAKEYLAAEDMSMLDQLDILWRLQACMREYAKLRYKTSYKTDKGKERMTRITKLLAMTDKFFEYQELLEVAKKENEEYENLQNELKDSDLAPEYVECKDQYSHYTKNNLAVKRWPQILLPYERDKKNNNQVTPETKENYEINKKFFRAYQSRDIRRQIAALGRIYLKQCLPDFSKEDLTPENVLKFEMERHTKGAQAPNRLILCDFLSELEKRMGNKNNPLVKYMGDRLSCFSRSLMTTAFTFHMANVGINVEANKKSIHKSAPGKEAEMMKYQEAQEMYEENYLPIDEKLEKQLRDFIKEVDKEELQAEKIVGSHEYVKETCRLQAKKETVDKQARPLIKEHYSKDLNENPELASLLIPFYKDKNGNVTNPVSKANKAYNDKFMTLIHSNDPEDRLAALASVYLRLKKFNWKDNEPTRDEVSEFGRQMISSRGFASQYQAFSSCLLMEAEITDHPMIHYMQEIYNRPLTTYSMNLVRLNNNTNGYDNSGEFLDNVEAEGLAEEHYNALLEQVKEEIEAEKASHGGHVIQQDLMMEDELRRLCRNKGIAIM